MSRPWSTTLLQFAMFSLCWASSPGCVSSSGGKEEPVTPGDDGADPGDDGVDPNEDTGGSGSGDDGGSGSTGDDGTYTGDDSGGGTGGGDPHDADSDGLSDAVEEYIGSDPHDPTTDEDSLPDGDEIHIHGTDPLCADTDGDGYRDDEEVETLFTDPTDPNDPDLTEEPTPDCLESDGEGTPDDLLVDHDGDGLTLEEELDCGSSDFALGTSHDPHDTDNDGLDDVTECATACLLAYDSDSDDDLVPDGSEAGHGLDPCDSDTDNDGLLDGEEWWPPYFTDPADADSDDDGLNDKRDYDEGCDPNDEDTDDDGLNDWFEVDEGIDCDDDDTDGDGMSDMLELKTGGGKTATDPTDKDSVVDFIDPAAGDVWQCSDVEAVSVSRTSGSSAAYGTLSFPDDEAYYGTFSRVFDSGSSQWIYTSTECQCNNVLIAATGALDIAGVTVWAEDDVHAISYYSGTTAYTSRATEANWATKSVPAGVVVSTAWVTGAQALYSATDTVVDESATDGDADQVWAAFYETTSTPDGTTASSTDPTGTVDLRVSIMTPDDSVGQPNKISDCDELEWNSTLSNGLQFRVDLVSAMAMLPPSYTTPGATESCTPGHTGHTRFALLALDGRRSRPIPLSGSARYAHARAKRIRVRSWNGASALHLVQPDGSRVVLDATTDRITLPGSGWLLSETDFRVERTELGGMKDPELEVEHTCTGSDRPSEGPVSVPGYTLSYQKVDQLLSQLGMTGVLQALWPALTDLDQSPFRVRLELPDRFLQGPDRAWLRLDVAGVGTLAKLPIAPDLPSGLRSVTNPADVPRWTVNTQTGGRTVGGSVEQTASGLDVTLTAFSLGDPGHEGGALSTPVQFTLPAE